VAVVDRPIPAAHQPPQRPPASGTAFASLTGAARWFAVKRHAAAASRSRARTPVTAFCESLIDDLDASDSEELKCSALGIDSSLELPCFNFNRLLQLKQPLARANLRSLAFPAPRPFGSNSSTSSNGGDAPLCARGDIAAAGRRGGLYRNHVESEEGITESAPIGRTEFPSLLKFGRPLSIPERKIRSVSGCSCAQSIATAPVNHGWKM
jgi:hypothetical protein